MGIGCGPELPDQVIESRWVRYHYWIGDEPCSEELERLDAFVDGLVDYFDLSLPDGFRVDYYKLRWPKDQGLGGRVCSNGEPCSSRTRVFTSFGADLHEVAHAVLFTVGNPPALFGEGIAEMLDCGAARRIGSVIDRSEPIQSLLRTRDWTRAGTATLRAAGAAYTRYLLDTYGMAPYLAFYGSIGRAAGESKIRRHFEDVFEATFESTVAAWRGSPEQRHGEICEFFVDACAQAPVLGASSPGDSTALSENVSCVDRAVVLDIAEATGVIIGVQADHPSLKVVLRACDTEEDAERTIVYDGFASPDLDYVGKRAELWSVLLPGRYSLRYFPMFLGDPETGAVDIDVTLESAPIATMCATAPSFTVPDGLWRIVLAGPKSELAPDQTAAVRLSFPTARAVGELLRGPGGSPFLCDSCPSNPDAECSWVIGTPPQVGETILWIEATPNEEPDYLIDIMFGPADG